MTKLWINAVANLSEIYHCIKVPTFKPSNFITVSDLTPWIQNFESSELDAEKVWLWRSWGSVNQNGAVSFLPLYPIYQRLGRAFTQQFFEISNAFFQARRSYSVPCLKSLTRFVAQYPESISAKDFTKPEFMDKFWRDFFVYHVTTQYDEGSGSRVSTIITEWRNHFIPFVREHLQAAGLFAEPWGGIPNPPPRTVAGANTHLRKTTAGLEVKTKLLTPIPIQVTDEEAVKILFGTIESELELVKSWAEFAKDDLWQRYQRRMQLALNGTARIVQKRGTFSGGHRWITDRENPDHLKNACATFSHHGYMTGQEAALPILYPRPLKQTADELGLPTADAFFPHGLLLTIEHPAITPSFLTKLEIFDKNGKLIGFIKTDAGYQLVGYKNRRGSKLAQQIITLSAIAAETVTQVLAITEPLRKWLREKGDDQWRYLFLTCKHCFGTPQRIRMLDVQTSSIDRTATIIEKLSKATNLPRYRAAELVSRLSLQKVRASVAVLIYLRTQSAEKMAKALGHAEYSPRLISHYLPKPLQEFFQERWIRIFQTGLVVEVMKESPVFQKASGFIDMNELHEFMSNHSLTLQTVSHVTAAGPSSDSSEQSGVREVVFGVNPKILAALISLKRTVDEATQHIDPRAKYWAAVGERLISYIESDLKHRPDLRSFVDDARKHADMLKIEGAYNG